jgi:NifU-like protein involved in Fe-S cluster formation
VNDEIIDELVQKLQKEIEAQALERFGMTFFQRWKHPKYMDAMTDPDVISLLKGTCGDSMMLFLKFRQGKVEKATFKTDGCAPTIVCGSYMAEMSLGKTPEELMDITAETIMAQFGELPEEHRHCAGLAASTIHKAVDLYMIDQVQS